MSARFPTRRADGSFDLLVKVQTRVATSLLHPWIAAWAEENGVWERRWESGGKIETEVLRFTDDFSGPPIIDTRADATVAVRFRVRAASRMWKDWSAKFYDDLRKEYAGDVELAGMESATE